MCCSCAAEVSLLTLNALPCFSAATDTRLLALKLEYFFGGELLAVGNLVLILSHDCFEVFKLIDAYPLHVELLLLAGLVLLMLLGQLNQLLR